MPGRTFLRSGVCVAVVSSLVSLGACGSSDTPASPGSTSTSASASADPEAKAERDAVKAYNNFWIAVAEAGEIPDPGYEDLAVYGSGDALDKVVKLITTYEELGRVMKGSLETNPKVKDVEPATDPSEVTLTDCADSTHWSSHDKTTGEEVDDGPNGTKRINAVVEQVDGAWKVTKFGMGAVGTC